MFILIVGAIALTMALTTGGKSKGAKYAVGEWDMRGGFVGIVAEFDTLSEARFYAKSKFSFGHTFKVIGE